MNFEIFDPTNLVTKFLSLILLPKVGSFVFFDKRKYDYGSEFLSSVFAFEKRNDKEEPLNLHKEKEKFLSIVAKSPQRWERLCVIRSKSFNDSQKEEEFATFSILFLKENGTIIEERKIESIAEIAFQASPAKTFSFLYLVGAKDSKDFISKIKSWRRVLFLLGKEMLNDKTR